MVLKLSRRSDIPVFQALDLLRVANERASSGADIVNLCIGQPSDGAPPEVLSHARALLERDPRQGYTESLGLPALRARISQWYKDYYGLGISPDRIAVTVGGSAAFTLAFLSVFEAGDRVALTLPCYPPYRNILTMLGIEVIEIETTAENNYQPTAAQLETIDGCIDGLIVTSPSNPTGTMIPRDELRRIAQWCDSRGVRLVSDELYHGITFKERAETVLRFTGQAIVVNSFSKYFAMTGWRLGWLVLPENLTDRVKRLSESLFISAPTLAQQTACRIFDHTDVLDSYVGRYARNLDILKAELPKAGIAKLSDVTGAFYLYADIGNLTDDSQSFCSRLLDSTGVAITPGMDFDGGRGRHTIRISFAGTTKSIETGCARIADWIKRA